MIIGTAGHIDHGKSSVVKALTGIDPDRLKEEQLRGITIDLGFAYLTFSTGAVAGIVDVPGHERLVHNMLAGAGGMDLAVVVVAADEGVEPQTREHVEILDLLGVSTGIGVITKIDLVGAEERALARLELEELLEETTLAGSPIVEVSTVTGEGIQELGSLLEQRASIAAQRPLHRPFRLPLDRVFTLQGFGTVVTGTAASGRVAVGQNLDIVPAGGDARVRGIHVHGTPRDEASAGQRVALNIVGRKLDCQRGFVLAEQGLFVGTDCLDCRLRLVRAATAKRQRSLTVRLYTGTSEVMARVVPLEDGVLSRAGEGYVQIRTVARIAAARGDRFVLRSEDDRLTLGGGTVLDAFAQRHGPKRGLTARTLGTLDGVPDDDAFDAFLVQHPQGLTFTEMARLLNLDQVRLTDLAARRREAGAAVLATDGARLLARSALDRFGEAIKDTLLEFHAANPLKPWMAVSDLRSRFEPRIHQALETALRGLEQAGAIVTEGGSLRLADHAVAFDADREKTKQRVLALYEQARLQPPSKAAAVAQLAEEGLPDGVGVIDSLVETGDLVAMSCELLVHTRVLDEAKTAMLPFLQAPQGITVGQAREILDTTRKYAVPLFELLDRQGFTVRRGDVRILSPSWGVSRQNTL